MADYLVLCADKEKKEKDKSVITDNRMVTINRRETSLEGLVSQFENGEDGVYNLITNDKNIIFRPKVTITEKDIEEIPEIQQIREAISTWEEIGRNSSGRDAYIAKTAIIDLRKEQYIVKDAYRKPVDLQGFMVSKAPIVLDGEITLDENKNCVSYGIVFTDPEVIIQILSNYSRLKQESYSKFDTNTWYMMEDFDNLCGRALKQYPLYEKIVELKIDGKQNAEIQAVLLEEFGIKHSVEYISNLWRQKIPTLIASQAEDDYLQWYYLTQEKGKYKKCSRCGQVKLAHNKYFSKNSTSRDGFYSICKECRNSK